MRNGFRVIDTDCHQMEPPSIWTDYIDPKFSDRAPRMGEIAHGKKGMCVEGEALTRQHGSYPMDSPEFIAASIRAMQRFAKTRATGFSPASRIEDMDAQGVDAQVIYPTVGGHCSASLSGIRNYSRPAVARTTTGASNTARWRRDGCAWPRCCQCRRRTSPSKRRVVPPRREPRATTCGRIRSRDATCITRITSRCGRR